MRGKPPILQAAVEWNIKTIKDMLKHPEQWGNRLDGKPSTRKDWEDALEKFERLLQED